MDSIETLLNLALQHGPGHSYKGAFDQRPQVCRARVSKRESYAHAQKFPM